MTLLLVKVCGITNAQDAAHAEACGADLLGFVNHPSSPRHCADIPAAAAAHPDKAVLVTVGDDPGPMIRLAEQANLRWIQPHCSREKRAEVVSALCSAFFRVILPWPDEPGQARVDADLYLWEPSPQVTGVLGGSGQGHAAKYPPPGLFLLAGGLDADNLAERLAALPASARRHLAGVDAASRLESAPGRKDPDKVRAFLETARAL